MRYTRADSECRSCFNHANFAAENITCGLSTECIRQRAAGDGRTKNHNINTACIEVPVYVGLALVYVELVQAPPNNVHVNGVPVATFRVQLRL